MPETRNKRQGKPESHAIQQKSLMDLCWDVSLESDYPAGNDEPPTFSDRNTAGVWKFRQPSAAGLLDQVQLFQLRKG